jgi:hypothetical protein
MQETTALSAAEAERYSASTAAVEVLYLRRPLENMGFAQSTPTPVYDDKTARIEGKQRDWRSGAREAH